MNVRDKRFRLIPFDALQPVAERPYLIKGLIPRCGIVVVWGPPKSGKSFWTFDAVMHVALGRSYQGRKVVAGDVVYCAFEGAEAYGKRAEAFRRRHLADRLTVNNFHLITTPTDLVLDCTEMIRAISEQLEHNHPVAVVLDTLNRSFRGSESEDKDMASYIKAADAIRAEFSCAVIIVHHCGVDKTRPRGHTSLTGAADAQLAVKRDRPGLITVKVEYMKDGQEGDSLKCRLEQLEVGRDSDGDPITSCVVEPVTTEQVIVADATKPLPKAARVALVALETAIAQSGTIGSVHGVPAGQKAVTIEQWRKQAYADGISASPNRRALEQAFKRAREGLLEAGVAKSAGEHVWLCSGQSQGGELANTP